VWCYLRLSPYQVEKMSRPLCGLTPAALTPAALPAKGIVAKGYLGRTDEDTLAQGEEL